MDMNIKALQQQPAVLTLKTENTRKSVGSFEAGGASPVTEAKKTEYTETELKQAVSKLNDYVQNTNRSVQFSVDHDSGTLVTKVVDAETEKVLWQMPSEDAIKLAHSLTSLMNSGLINIFSSKA